MGIGLGYTLHVAAYLERFTIKHREKITRNGRGTTELPTPEALFAVGTSHFIKINRRKGVRVYAYADYIALVADSGIWTVA